MIFMKVENNYANNIFKKEIEDYYKVNLYIDNIFKTYINITKETK